MTEWRLHPEIVNQILGTWGTPAVDMFATVHNTHLPHFMSPVREPQALAIDVLSQDWQGRSTYMFPPFPLLSKVIQKLRTIQEGEVIQIAPWWLTQPWFPYLIYVFGPPSFLPISLRPTVTTVICLERQVIPSARMEALMQH